MVPLTSPFALAFLSCLFFLSLTLAPVVWLMRARTLIFKDSQEDRLRGLQMGGVSRHRLLLDELPPVQFSPLQARRIIAIFVAVWRDW